MVNRWKLALRLLLCCALPATAQDMLAEAELAPSEVYVQAQAVYRLRFLHAIDVRDVQLTAPSARLADLRPIGGERLYEAQRGGHRYRVHERSFAVFPFSSGKLELAGARIEGRSAGGQTLRLEVPARTLTVLPADIGADGAPWLPAASLALTEEWKTRENGVHRRTIRIEAAGVQAAQLPEPTLTVDCMGALAEPPVLRNRFDGERNIATREQTFVLMPARPGLATVPEFRLRWWRTDTRTSEFAVLPPRTLYLGEPGAADPPRPAALVPAAFGHLWALGAVLALLLALVLLRSGRIRHALRLRRACRAADPLAVRDALLAWSAEVWPAPPRTLAALAVRLGDNAAGDGVRALERSLYGPGDTAWTPDRLAAIVAEVQRAARRPHPTENQEQ